MWHDTFEINVMATVRMIREVLPRHDDSGTGVILDTGSLNARLPDPLVLDYSAAKAALVNMAKALSKEVGPHGIRVATVDPDRSPPDLWLGDGGVANVVSRRHREVSRRHRRRRRRRHGDRTLHSARRGS